MTDDGEDYTYVYDPFGRLRKVESRANATLVAEYRYNGLNQRITTHFDTDADKDVDGNDVISHFAYDGRWRMAARYEDTDTDPTEQWVFHHAGLAESGSSSYIDSVILRDRDTSANGTLDERVYYLQNWRADVVALIKDNGDQIEQVRYEPYGSPFGLPAGDTDGDGDVDQADVDQVTAWYNASSYDSRGDLNMDGAVNLTDITRVTAAKVNGDTLGLYGLSLVGNRKGYAGYEALSELTDSKWDVRYRVLKSKLGQWDQRDPLEYVDGMNLYSYARHPISATDPLGLCRLTGPADVFRTGIVSSSGVRSSGSYRTRLHVERSYKLQTISQTERRIEFEGYYLQLDAWRIGFFGRPAERRSKPGSLLRRVVTISCDEDCYVQASVIDGVISQERLMIDMSGAEAVVRSDSIYLLSIQYRSLNFLNAQLRYQDILTFNAPTIFLSGSLIPPGITLTPGGVGEEILWDSNERILPMWSYKCKAGPPDDPEEGDPGGIGDY